MPRLSELLVRAAVLLLLAVAAVAPFYLATVLPNMPEPTGLELLGSFWLGLLIRFLLIGGALHCLATALKCSTRYDQHVAGILSATTGCVFGLALLYLR